MELGSPLTMVEESSKTLDWMLSGIILRVDYFNFIDRASPFLTGVKLLIYFTSTDYFFILNYCFGISISSLVIDLVRDFLD